MPTTALVTGATGFLGRHLVTALLRDPEMRVRALVRSAPTALPRTVDVVHGDLTMEDGRIERAVDGCDVVFHCAAVVGDRVSWAAGRAVNVDGARRVAKVADKTGVKRFIHVSSVAVYGFDAGTYDEGSPRVCPGEPYIDTKSRGEEACEAELRDGSTRLVIMRPAVIYGPGDTECFRESWSSSEREFP